jgi:hypothetical protein
MSEPENKRTDKLAINGSFEEVIKVSVTPQTLVKPKPKLVKKK